MSVTEATHLAESQEGAVVKGYLLEVCDFTMVSVSEPQANSEGVEDGRQETAEKPQGRQNLVRIQRTDKCRVNKEQTTQTGISFVELRHGAIVRLA